MAEEFPEREPGESNLRFGRRVLDWSNRHLITVEDFRKAFNSDPPQTGDLPSERHCEDD